jgi:hypothetical protein
MLQLECICNKNQKTISHSMQLCQRNSRFSLICDAIEEIKISLALQFIRQTINALANLALQRHLHLE